MTCCMAAELLSRRMSFHRIHSSSPTSLRICFESYMPKHGYIRRHEIRQNEIRRDNIRQIDIWRDNRDSAKWDSTKRDSAK